MLEAQSRGVRKSGVCGRHGEELGHKPNANISIICSLEKYATISKTNPIRTTFI